MSIDDVTPFAAKVTGVLEKFDGEPLPENLVEKLYIEDDAVIKVEYFEDGVKTGEEIVEEGGTN